MPLLLLRFLPHIAAVLAVLAVVGGIYAKGRLDASHAAEVARLEENLAIAQRNAEREREARAVDAINLVASRQRLDLLQTKTDELLEYINELEDASRVCLSGADTERLRRLWE